MTNQVFSLHQMAHAIRVLSMDAVEKAQSGHPGMPMGMADVVTILFTEFIKHAPWIPCGQTEIDSFNRRGMGLCCCTAFCISLGMRT